MRILGLDLGITSIGWALIDQPSASAIMPEDTTLVDWGSRIFEPGMEDDIDSGKGVSRCVQRRLKRSLRIQYRRRRQRKNGLIKILTEASMLPKNLTPDFFVQIDKKLLDTYPVEVRRQYGHVVPYIYRRLALEQDLSPEELGRTIYHLAQRRGYLSNRKKDLKDSDELGKVQSGIQSLKEAMKQMGARTLGEYFSYVDPEEERIRTRYTERAMYVDEFRMICARQRALISEDLEKELFKAIFFQRKLKSCAGLVGQCRYEKKEKRCSFNTEEAQLYRLFSTLENLRVENKDKEIRSLTRDEKCAAINLLNGFSEDLDSSGRISLQALGKAVGLAKGEKFTLGEDEKKIYGNALHAKLFRIFGEKCQIMSEDEIKKFWHDLQSIEKESTLLRRLTGYWKLDEEHARIALDTVIPDDYCALSQKALKKILPGLQLGVDLTTVVAQQYPESISFASTGVDVLPSIDNCGIELRNPVVHRTLTELRYVVNTIIARYGKPDYIRIELARNLKSTNKERERIKKQNSENEKNRERIAKLIAEEAGVANPSRNDILKVMLAEECGFECPYTGTQFNMKELLHGGNVHIEHIIPFSRSFDDSYRNKTLCLGTENAKKSNRTPYEAYEGEEYQKILARVKHFKGNFAEQKLHLFEAKKIEPEEFLERNLNDTRYVSKLAIQYLSKLYGGIVDAKGLRRIQACAGGCTALVRRAWGGNYVLGEGEKIRSDHRHHAVDALTIAMITPTMVKLLANMPPEKRRAKFHDGMPLFNTTLLDQAQEKLDSATVSHHVVNKVRGQLHDETIYSRKNDKTFTRIKLENLSIKDVPQIKDGAIRRAVIEKLGADPEVPTSVLELKEDVLKLFKNPENYPVLKDSNGNPVNTIKTVKVSSNVKTRLVGKDDQAKEVKTNGNYVLAVFAKKDSKGNETAWEYQVVSRLDAALCLKKHHPILDKQRDGYVFKFSLVKGDIVTFFEDGRELICIVRAISEAEVICVPIQDARQQKELKAARVWFRLRPGTAMNCHLRKFTMTLFGELRRAND